MRRPWREPPVTAAPPADAAARLRAFRARTLILLLRASFVITVAAMTVFTPLLWPLSQLQVLVGWAACASVGAGAWLPGLPHGVRAWSLAAPAILALAATLPVVGPAALLTASFAVVFLALLVGPRSATVAALLVVGVLVAGALHPGAWARLSTAAPGASRPLLAALGALPALGVAIIGITLVLRGLERGFDESLVLLRSAHESDRRFRGVFDASPNAVAVFAVPGGLFLDVNPGFERLFGWTRAEVAGRRVHDLGVLRAEDRELLGIRLAEGRNVDGLELTVRRKDGALLHVQVGVRLADIDGERVIMAVARDVTTERRLQAALRHAQRAEAMGQLAGGIAHNFRNALGAVVTSLDVCLDDPPPTLTQPLRDARTAAARAVDLAGRLARMARGDPSPRREPVELQPLLAEVASLCRSTFGARIAIEEDLAATGAVLADRSELHDTFLNLCLNARDALAEAPSPRLQLALHRSDDGRALVATVADDGCGMTPETLERIWEPFFTTKGEGRGLGLGLPTAYATVRDAGGHVEVESAPGAGTTFRITLPIHAGAAAPPPARGARRVVVVDRDPEALETMARQLAALGLAPEPFDDPLAALERLRRSESGLDLLVTGIPPGPDGGALVDALRRAAPAVPMIVVGGTADAAPGIVAALAKPASSRELAAAVARGLGLGPSSTG